MSLEKPGPGPIHGHGAETYRDARPAGVACRPRRGVRRPAFAPAASSLGSIRS